MSKEKINNNSVEEEEIQEVRSRLPFRERLLKVDRDQADGAKVSFIQAEKLQRVGFGYEFSSSLGWRGSFYYIDNPLHPEHKKMYDVKKFTLYNKLIFKFFKPKFNDLPCPTVSDALLWLRTSAGLTVFVEHGSNDKYDVTIRNFGCMRGGYKTYEIAQSAGLTMALDLIIQYQESI